MIDPAVHLRIAGLAVVVIGLAHVLLPRALGWSAEFALLTPMNRQISYVHCAFIALTCLLLGALPLALPGALLAGGELSVALLGGLVVFWGARLIVQIAVFDPALWRGSRSRTAVHLAFIALWTYQTAVYAGAALVASRQAAG